MKKLTKTENKIARAISRGMIEKEIAQKLYVSVHTIHAHTRNIRKKINARNMVDVARHYILSLENPNDVLLCFFILVFNV